MLSAIFSSGAVWAALLSLVEVCLLLFVPQFPQAIWASISALIVVILATAGINVQRTAVKSLTMPTLGDRLTVLLRSGVFWGGLLVFVQLALFIAVPEFPRELWVALSGLIVGVLGAIGVNVVTEKARAAR